MFSVPDTERGQGVTGDFRGIYVNSQPSYLIRENKNVKYGEKCIMGGRYLGR